MRNGLLVCAVATLAILALATQGLSGEWRNEREPNHPIRDAEGVQGQSDSVSVSAVLGEIGFQVDDLDFYRFQAEAGDVLTADIEGGFGGAQPVDTFMAIFIERTDEDGSPSYELLRWNDDAVPNVDRDARIENFLAPEAGTYVIGVSNYPRSFNADGTVRYPQVVRSGDYTLVVTGLRPAVVQVGVLIKPGSEDSAPINPRAKGKIPVAILARDDFDPLKVDPESLRFGAHGDEDSLESCGGGFKAERKGKGPLKQLQGEDVNGDGLPDLVCHFRIQDAGFEVGVLEAVLKGRFARGSLAKSASASGTSTFEGRTALHVIPQKPPR